MTKIVE